MTKLDNVTVLASALQKRRLVITDTWSPHHAAYDRWLTANKPDFHVFYIVSGIREFKANPNRQTSLSLMPCMMVKGSNTGKAFPIYEEEFKLFAFITKVEEIKEEEGWISVDAIIGQHPAQSLTCYVPERYSRWTRDIMAKIALPANIQEQKGGDARTSLGKISPLRFHKFHLVFHPSNIRQKCYGVIDRMWGSDGRELELSLPPEFCSEPQDEPQDETKAKPQTGPIASPKISPDPKPDNQLTAFLKSQSNLTTSFPKLGRKITPSSPS